MAVVRATADEPLFRTEVDALIEKLLVGARPETRNGVLTSVHATPRDVLQFMISGMGTFEPTAALAGYAGPISCVVTDRTVSKEGTPGQCRTVVRLHRVSHWPTNR